MRKEGGKEAEEKRKEKERFPTNKDFTLLTSVPNKLLELLASKNTIIYS